MAFFKALFEPPEATPAPAPTPALGSPRSLHEAAARGDLDVVKTHFGDTRRERRASLLMADSGTSLLAAAAPISPSLSKEDKARIANSTDEQGKTPLHCAAEGGYSEVVEYLLGVGADKNKKDNSNATALDLAKRHLAPAHRAIALLTYGLAPEAAPVPAGP